MILAFGFSLTILRTICRALWSDALRHRACVHDDKIGGLRQGRRSAACHELFFDFKRVGLIDAAAECDDGVLSSRLLEIACSLLDLVRQTLLIFLKPIGDVLVANSRESAPRAHRIGRFPASRSTRSPLERRRHLNRRQQGVEALQCRRVDRYADHRFHDVGCHDAGEMRCGAGSDDEDVDATRAGLVDQPQHALRGSMGRKRPSFRPRCKLLQHIDGRPASRARRSASPSESATCNGVSVLSFF